MRGSHDVEAVSSGKYRAVEIAARTSRPANEPELPVVVRLRDQLAERDEIIVALQHIIRDLRHEIENLRVEDVYATFAQR